MTIYNYSEVLRNLKNKCSLQVFHLSWLRKSFLLCNGAVVRKNDQRMCSSSNRRRGREKKVSSIAFDVAFTSQKDLSIERSRKSKSKLFYTLAKRIRIARLVYVFNSIFNDVVLSNMNVHLVFDLTCFCEI